MMTINFTIREIYKIKDLARRFLEEMDESLIIPGTGRELEFGERVTLAHANATVSILNRRGALKDGFVIENNVELEEQDMESIEEYCS